MHFSMREQELLVITKFVVAAALSKCLSSAAPMHDVG